MQKRKQLLDMGCGDASLCIKYVKEGYDVVGVDKNPDVFEMAKNKVAASKEKQFIKLYNQDIRELKTTKKFDGILFNFVLMFMPKKDALSIIEKYYKKLNIGGEMLIQMLLHDDPIAIRAKQKEVDAFFPSYDEMKKLKKEYKGELKFELKRDSPHNNLDYPHIHSVGSLKIVR